MRKLIMWNLMTLDGCFEGPQAWDLEFHEYAWGEELKRFSLEQSREVGALLFGRATYVGMAAHWPTAKGETAELMNTVPKYVFSRTLESADWSNTTLVNGDTAEVVAQLKEQPGKDLFVLGSADLSAALIRHRLFDEYRIGLVPITVGEGNPLFKRDSEPLRLELLQSRPLGERCLLLRYRPTTVAAAR